MKAISLWQPWATAIALGIKGIETRHWQPRYRGMLAIHAAKRWTREEREFSLEMARLHGEPRLEKPPLGAIVAICNLRDVKRSEELRPSLSSVERTWGNYGKGRFGWLLENVQPLPEPIPCKGAQGLFDVADDLGLMSSQELSDIRECRQGKLF